MSCNFGSKIKLTIFGQSHSQAIGCVLDGVPAGIKIDLERIEAFMARRAPGKNKISTARKEADKPNIISGIVDGVTCGAPICAIIENSDTRSGDYDKLRALPRPSHSDYAAFMKHNGFNDIRGGGNFSGRMTAPLCFAGAVCIQILESKGIYIGAHISSIGTVDGTKFDPSFMLELSSFRTRKPVSRFWVVRGLSSLIFLPARRMRSLPISQIFL